MQRHKTQGIVLRRTNYQDNDRIISMITKGSGRLSLIVKGVRKPASRMAAGVEAFTVSNIEYIYGKRELAILVSARILRRFDNLIRNYERAELAGKMLDLMNKTIEDEVSIDYFMAAHEVLCSLDDSSIGMACAETWFRLQLLGLGGRQPELINDYRGDKLSVDKQYSFDSSEGNFRNTQVANFSNDTIRAWRVLTIKTPHQAKLIRGLDTACEEGLESLRLFMANSSF